MPDLLVRLKKGADGDSVLSCLRSDGSATWQRNDGVRGRFFPLHDLTHFAVETVLKHRRGFFGSVADGWDLEDFGSPWPCGPLPEDMDPGEAIVGLLDIERSQGVRLPAATFHEIYPDSMALRLLSDDDLDRVRARRTELISLWEALPAGDTLELRFDHSFEDL